MSQAQVYSDPPQKGQGKGEQHWLPVTLGPIMAAAQRDLRLISPYFVPGAEGVRWLGGMRARGVEVGVLTNSLAANDVVAVHGGYAGYRKPLLEAGVELFELMPHGQSNSSLFGSSGASLHTKAFAVDGETGFIGSFNMDPVSYTHLDVYKRQSTTGTPLPACRMKTGGACSGCGSLEWSRRFWMHGRWACVDGNATALGLSLIHI